MNIVIVDYGVGNRTSVRHAFARLGVSTVLTANPDEIKAADAVVLPGVGSAGPAQQALQAQGLDVLLRELQQPVLGICLGMQLLADYLEEDRAPGLGILAGDVLHLEHWPTEATKAVAGPVAAPARVPHMGWALLEPADERSFSDPLLAGDVSGEPRSFSDPLLAGGLSGDPRGFNDPLLAGLVLDDAVYFAHSYALHNLKHATALTRHGKVLFPSVVRHRNFWGCQFHPEKSSQVGARILKNFIRIAQRNQ